MIDKETLDILEWGKIAERLLSLCATDAGRLHAGSISFSSDPRLISRHLEENTQMRLLVTTDKPPDLRDLPLLGDTLVEAEAGSTLSVESIISLMKAIRATEQLRKYFHERRGKYHALSRIARGLANLSELRSDLEGTIDYHGEIKDSASPLVPVLRRRIESARERVAETANKIMSAPNYQKHLQDRYVTVRGGRHALPFKPSAKGVIRGILHETSQSGQTIFFEPEELVHANNELKTAESEFAAEVRKIIGLISKMMGSNAHVIGCSIASAAHIDCILARALLAEEFAASEPQVTHDGSMKIIAARNPLLLLGKKQAVPNTVQMGGKRRCLIVTGPNAGGKTVLIKTVGLLTLMTMAGLSIPASPDSRVSIFQKVFIAMGDMQSVERDLSTFSADILTLKNFFEGADKDTLIFLDEVITGTDPKEGTALGQAYLKALVNKGSTVFVTTHFDEIKYLPYEDERFVIATMGFSEKDLAPTFQLIMGVPGRSMGIQIAEKIGFPPTIIGEAKRYLGSKEEKLNLLIGEIAGIKEREERALDELSREKTRMEELTRKGREERRILKEKEEEFIHGARVKALNIVRDAEEQVEKIMDTLRKERKVEVVRKAKDVLSKIKKDAGQREVPPEVQKIISGTKPVKRSDDLTPGQRVFVLSLGKDAFVDSPEEGRGKAAVTLGSMRSVVDITDIRVYETKGGQEGKRGERSRPADSSGVASHIERDDNTLDVRGLDGEEALVEVELFLDRAALRDTPSVFIIHGHGTGILKKVIRGYLSGSPYVEGFSRAPKEHGGDGATVVKLK